MAKESTIYSRIRKAYVSLLSDKVMELEASQRELRDKLVRVLDLTAIDLDGRDLSKPKSTLIEITNAIDQYQYINSQFLDVQRRVDHLLDSLKARPSFKEAST